MWASHPDGPEHRDHPEKQFPMPGFISRSSLPALSNSLLPFIESSYYYYCHHKGLDLHIAKLETPVFPPPRGGFFHCPPDCLSFWRLLLLLSLGTVCDLGKRGIYFPPHTSCLLGEDQSSPAVRTPRAPVLFSIACSRHLQEPRAEMS